MLHFTYISLTWEQKRPTELFANSLVCVSSNNSRRLDFTHNPTTANSFFGGGVRQEVRLQLLFTPIGQQMLSNFNAHGNTLTKGRQKSITSVHTVPLGVPHLTVRTPRTAGTQRAISFSLDLSELHAELFIYTGSFNRIRSFCIYLIYWVYWLSTPHKCLI